MAYTTVTGIPSPRRAGELRAQAGWHDPSVVSNVETAAAPHAREKGEEYASLHLQHRKNTGVPVFLP